MEFNVAVDDAAQRLQIEDLPGLSTPTVSATPTRLTPIWSTAR
ncbi:MAG: hypothetical protein R2856_30945 [Caldilineaceae bacterium]